MALDTRLAYLATWLGMTVWAAHTSSLLHSCTGMVYNVAAMRFLIADDHALNREMMRTMLENTYSDAVIFEAEDYETAKVTCQRHKPILVVLDVSMPGTTGLLGVLEMIQRFPNSKVLICSAVDNPVLVRTMLSFGAKGFISKAMSSKELIRAIDCILKDEIYIPDFIDNAHSIRFTPRQSEILGMICSGLNNKEIANQLDVSVHTVKLHVSSVLETLGVQNRMQVIALCGLHSGGI